MTSGEFFKEILLSLLWPPKGIIYMETQILMWLYAIVKVWLKHNGYVLLIGAGIIFAISCAVFGNTRVRMPRMAFHRIWSTIARVVTNIVFAWFFLIYGAARGEVRGNAGQNNATISHSRRVYVGPVWNVVHNFTRISLHFHLGRGLFRLFYRLLGLIPRLSNENGERSRRVIARLLAMVVIFWGVWMIPYELTH